MRGSETDFRRRLMRWYDRHRRALPWRTDDGSRPDPYHVLVSEAMLQQTQVATVVPYFQRFLERVPTFSALAAAPEQDILRLWQGLGYYSRARNLHAAAKRVMSQHCGELPQAVEALRNLPGVGRYTAGAVASIAFDCRAPILDGNVMRVLCRIDRIESDPREKRTQERLWLRAEQILPAKRCGDFNSALMELGAIVCTPRNPQCLLCPVRHHCEAASAGVQEQIPPSRKRQTTPLLKRTVMCVRCRDRYLIEQRPPRGRWGGMWQFVTFDGGWTTTARSLRRLLALDVARLEHLGQVTHALTHRRYEFEVYACKAKRDGHAPSPRAWATLDELDRYPLPRPHLKVIQLLRDHGGANGLAPAGLVAGASAGSSG